MCNLIPHLSDSTIHNVLPNNIPTIEQFSEIAQSQWYERRQDLKNWIPSPMCRYGVSLKTMQVASGFVFQLRSLCVLSPAVISPCFCWSRGKNISVNCAYTHIFWMRRKSRGHAIWNTSTFHCAWMKLSFSRHDKCYYQNDQRELFSPSFSGFFSSPQISFYKEFLFWSLS